MRVRLSRLVSGRWQGTVRRLDAPSQSLQCLFDLDVTIVNETLITVVQLNGLLKGKYMLCAIIPDESFLDCIE